MKKSATLTLLLPFMACAILASCSDKLPENTEGLLKAQLASIELVEEVYTNAYNTIERVVKYEKITADGYKGISDNPDNVISSLEKRLTSINNARYIVYNANMDSTNIEINTLDDRYALEILKRMQNIQVVLSEPKQIKTSDNKSKIWTFTELNSGYEFIATYNTQDGSVVVSLSGAGEEKVKKDLSVYIENVKNIYNRYTEIVSAENMKREQRRAIRRANNPDGIDWFGVYGLD